MAAAAILGIVANLVGPAIELGKCIAEPIKRRYNYLCCYNSNIQKLGEKAGKLEDARRGLQMQVNTAQGNAEEILPEVNTWFDDVSKIQEKKTRVDSELANIRSGCFAVKSRLSLSKEAENTTEATKKLQDRRRSFNRISNPAPPAAAALVPLGSTYDFQSRKDIEEDIVKALREFNMMGICGMGGIGKTTMAKRVENRLKEEGLFDETVMVVVSQKVDVLKIQDEMSGQLGLELKEKDSQSRAHKLHTRLTGGKRILLVLDDVWGKLRLEELGMPCEIDSKGCKILLTSRDSSVLNKMDAQKVCEIQTLLEEEAWSLFKEKTGPCVDDPNLISIARKVVEECKGLPVALVTVAGALKNQRKKPVWEDAVQQLKSSNPTNISDLLKDVYNPLKLSYDFLESEQARSIFLLCSLFPEDRNIPLQDLVVYAMGLSMFEDIRNMGLAARNRTDALVETLKSRYLLLKGWDDYHVRMHDVVRDVAIFIASEEKRIKCNDCTWISPFLGGRMDLPIGNLRLLSIDNSAGEKLKNNDNFFEGMTKLNVLSIRNVSWSSLPDTTRLLKNLRTLILHSCGLLETISIVGELVNLEILSCRDCHSIENLPREIGQLDRLKFLEFSVCWELKTIEPGIIPKLVRLEELKMVASFDKWEAENNNGKDRKNAELRELQSLHNLTCLEIKVEDSTLAAEQICLPSNIVNFHITIGDKIRGHRNMAFKKQMELNLPREIILGGWIYEYVRGVECMFLAGDGSHNLDLGQSQSMKSWTFLKCSTMKKLVNIKTSSTTTTTTVLPLLEYLELDELVNLEEICDIDGPIPDEGSGSKSFKNLKELSLRELPALKHLWKNQYQHAISLSNLSSIEIYVCHNLRYLFSWAMPNDCPLQLKSLRIDSCNMMKQIFLWNEEENKKDIGQECHHITFPKLKKLRLRHLPNLTTFYQGIESIEFPVLTKMEILCCPQLKCLVSNTASSSGCCNNENNLGGINNDRDHDADSSHLFCRPEKAAFGSLKTLVIRGYKNTSIFGCYQIPFHFLARLEYLIIRECGGISLFSASAAKNLVNLRQLAIWGCEKMVKVIEDENNEKDAYGGAETTNSLFPKLKELSLKNLRNLKSFCKCVNLRELAIWGCEKTVKVIEDENNEKDACGGAETTNSLFPKLKELSLKNLPNLKSFCKWRCALEFPSLKRMWIEDCPEMEKFSLGSLTTPNLEGIGGDVDIKTNEDLNGALQRRLVRVKEEREEKRKKRQEEDKQDSETEEYIVTDSETEEEEI